MRKQLLTLINKMTTTKADNFPGMMYPEQYDFSSRDWLFSPSADDQVNVYVRWPGVQAHLALGIPDFVVESTTALVAGTTLPLWTRGLAVAERRESIDGRMAYQLVGQYLEQDPSPGQPVEGYLAGQKCHLYDLNLASVMRVAEYDCDVDAKVVEMSREQSLVWSDKLEEMGFTDTPCPNYCLVLERDVGPQQELMCSGHGLEYPAMKALEDGWSLAVEEKQAVAKARERLEGLHRSIKEAEALYLQLNGEPLTLPEVYKEPPLPQVTKGMTEAQKEEARKARKRERDKRSARERKLRRANEALPQVELGEPDEVSVAASSSRQDENADGLGAESDTTDGSYGVAPVVEHARYSDQVKADRRHRNKVHRARREHRVAEARELARANLDIARACAVEQELQRELDEGGDARAMLGYYLGNPGYPSGGRIALQDIFTRCGYRHKGPVGFELVTEYLTSRFTRGSRASNSSSSSSSSSSK